MPTSSTVTDTNDFLGLVNGALAEFVGFVRDDLDPTDSDSRAFHPPKYMLVKMKDAPANEIQLSELPRGVVPLEPVQFTHRQGGRKKDSHGRWAELIQFSVTLGYAITDYKAQGSTFREPIVVDLKKPSTGSSASASAYVQLSRATKLDH